jgi:hypothetical protein
VTQVFDRFFEELAFGHVPIHLVFSKDFEDLVDVLLMFGFISTVDQDVINVNNDTNVQERLEDVLN